MKFVIACLCALSACVHAQAQRNNYTSGPYASAVTPIRLQEVAPLPGSKGNLPGQYGIRTGKTLTIVGSVLLVGGIALVSTADALYYNSTTTNGTTTESGDLKGGVGVILIAGGVGMIIPGVIIWSKSKKKYDRYLMEHREQSLHLQSGSSGLGLAYRF